MTRIRVSIQLHPQHCSMKELRDAWRNVDRDEFDAMWTWDHFFPIYGDESGPHFEGWSVLAAMAADTKRVPLGMLVSCNGYRNPELLADMARTIDHISGGRLILGIGAGWAEHEYRAYGYEYGDAAFRLRQLSEDLPRIKERLSKLNPPPMGRLPILVGGEGEKVTLRLVAEYADIWNMRSGPVDDLARKMRALDSWCERVGRDPSTIERTLVLRSVDFDSWAQYVEIGFSHLILGCGAPFDLTRARWLLEQQKAQELAQGQA